MQLEEINQKVVAKGGLNDTERGSNNTNKTKHSKTTKENTIWGRICEDIPKTGCKGSKTILEKKIWEWIYKKVEWLSNIEN